jgi:tetratricopeptide (TPR) repeat protein
LAAAEGHEEIVRLLIPHSGLGDSVTVEGLISEHAAAASELQTENSVASEPVQSPEITVAISDEAKDAANDFKNEGNILFAQKDYTGAIAAYSNGIERDPLNKVLFSNRSAAYVIVGDPQSGVADGRRCRELDPKWVKGYYREGAAHIALKE